MATVLPEALAMRGAGERAPLARPLIHLLDVFVIAVMFAEPTSLAGVLGQHGAFALDCGGDIDDEIGPEEIFFAIASANGVHEIEVRDGVQRIAACAVIRCGRREAGVARQGAGGFVVAVVVDRRRCQHDIRARLAQGFGHPAARGIVVEDDQIAHLEAHVIGADVHGCGGCLAAAEICNLVGPQVGRAAVAGRERRYGDGVTGAGQQRERATGQDFGVVRVRVNCENTSHGVYFHAA